MPAWLDEDELTGPDPRSVWPQTAGTFVDGCNVKGQCFSSTHRGHIFELLEDPITEELSSGYTQGVACVLDGEVWRTVDGAYLGHPASQELLGKVHDNMTAEFNRLRAALVAVRQQISG